MHTVRRKLLALLIAAPLSAVAAAYVEKATAADDRPYSPYADIDYPTDVFFGDTHVHTALSGDAGPVS